MKRLTSLIPLLAFCCLAQQPFLFYGGAYHAATYAPAGLPNAGLPRGGLITVFGRNLGPAAGVSASAFPLGPTLAGVRLQLQRGTQTVDLLPVFVSAGQINAILPSNAPTGRSVLRLQFNSATSNTIPVDVVTSNFGAFSINSRGFGPAIVTNFLAQDSQPINSLEQAAQPGQVITIWGTGLGPVSFADNIAPTPGDVTSDVAVYIGGVLAPRLYAGRAPCCAGLDQIVVTIPPQAPQGCWVPVQVRAGGITSNTTTIAIAGNPTACSDPHSRFSRVLREGGRLARFLTTRASIRADVAIPQPINLNMDSVIAQFAEYNANPFAWQLFDSLPPAGSCATYTSRGDTLEFTAALAGLTGTPIDPGSSLSIQAAASTAINRFAGLSNLFYTILSNGLSSFFQPNAPFRITGAGSPALPPFEVRTTPDLTSPWLNRDATQRFTTGQPISLTWTSQSAGMVVAIGSSFLRSRNASAFFACTALAQAGRLTVPGYITAVLPKEPLFFEAPSGVVGLVYVPNPEGTGFTLPGSEAAAIHLNVSARTVSFQ